MYNYCILEVFYKDGGLFERVGANFKARGIKHAQSIVDTDAEKYKESRHPLDLTVNFRVFFNTTNPAFVADQLKVYRGNVSGFVSHQIAPLSTLKSTV